MRIGPISFWLTVLFVVLKLVGVVSWSWWLVFLPLIVTVGLSLLGMLFAGFLMVLSVAAGSRRF